MDTDTSVTYLQRIWRKVKRVLSEPKSKRKGDFYVTNEGDSDCYQGFSKRPRMELINKSNHDSFDQSAFLEVMKKLLTCSVCLEVRKQANQCQNGHLICMNCTLCLQQSSTSKDINCPVCRVPLTGCYQRSLLAEQLVSELPAKCRLCSSTMSVKQLAQHESEVCLSRIINCQYALFGCNWKGLAKQKRHHELICGVGLSSIASASDVVNLNLKKQLTYYEKRNSQWNSTITKLRERNKGLKMFMKHLVLTKKKHELHVKSTFTTSKWEILNHQFQMKFTIIKNKKTQSDVIYYKMKYLSKLKIALNFFLYSIRYDDDVFELDDNLHYHTFSEDENNAGGYNIHFSGNQFTDSEKLSETLSVKDSLYLEIVLILDSSDLHEYNSVLTSQQEGTESLAQAISANRSGTNAGNLVVALISSNSLPSPANEEASEEQDDQDDDAGEQEEPEEEQDEEHEAEEQDAEDHDEEQDAEDQEEEEHEAEDQEEEQDAEDQEEEQDAEDQEEENDEEEEDQDQVCVEELNNIESDDNNA